MTPEKRIEKYYIERLNKYDNEIQDAIKKILGPGFEELYAKKRGAFYTVFTASKEGLEYHLGLTPEQKDKEVIEYLLEKIEYSEEKTGFLINKGYPLEREDNDYKIWLKDFNRYFLETYFPQNQLFAAYCKIDIFEEFRDGYFLDVYYIHRLLTYLADDYKENHFYDPRKTFAVDCKIEKSNEKIYLRINNTIAIQIVSLLRQKNIYLFDEPSELNEIIEGKYLMVSPKFISAFQDLIPLFLLEPQKFIDIVGRDNFRDFTICSLDRESALDIDEIINRMLIEREKKISYEIVGINLPLIAKSKEIAEEEKKKQPQNTQNNKPQLRSFGSLKSDPKFRDLIFENLPIINNLNNLQEIDTEKFNKIFPIDTREKYFNPDDLPPRR